MQSYRALINVSRPGLSSIDYAPYSLRARATVSEYHMRCHQKLSAGVDWQFLEDCCFICAFSNQARCLIFIARDFVWVESCLYFTPPKLHQKSGLIKGNSIIFYLVMLGVNSPYISVFNAKLDIIMIIYFTMEQIYLFP